MHIWEKSILGRDKHQCKDPEAAPCPAYLRHHIEAWRRVSKGDVVVAFEKREESKTVLKFLA